MPTVIISKKWSNAEKLIHGRNVKIFFEKTPFEYLLKDFGNNRQDLKVVTNELTSPIIINFTDYSHSLIDMNDPTISFKTECDESFEITYEQF